MKWRVLNVEEFCTIEEARDVIRDLLDERIVLLDKIRSLMARLEQSERNEEQISVKLMHNPVSGLPNHRKMDSDIGPLLWDFFQLANPPRISVFLIKLDHNYRHCRQSFSSTVHHNILYTVAARLKEILDHRGLLYHPRQDEFAVFFFDSLGKEELRRIASELLSCINLVHTNHLYKIKIGANIGIATFPDDGLNKRLLLANADMALHHAIAKNLDSAFFTEDMRNNVIENLEMQNNLLSAIEVRKRFSMNRDFNLFFQPIIRIEKINKSGVRISGIKAEVLIRWNDPNRGSRLPQNLIEVAEETGLILPIGRWMLKSVMTQLVDWNRSHPDLALSVNISPRQFFNNSFSSELKEMLDLSGLNAEKIYLEITESCLFNDQEQAVKEIEKLSAMGFKIALDDFGTGYSSLGYLDRFHADVLKIDRVFTEGLEAEGKKRDVIKSILSMGRKLGLDIIFEGIESRKQLEKAFELGCRDFQGFLFSRPLSMEDFEKFLEKADGGELPFQLI